MKKKRSEERNIINKRNKVKQNKTKQNRTKHGRKKIQRKVK